MHIVLIKQTDKQLEGPQADAVRQFLFGWFKGADESDEKAWRRFVRAMNEGAAGEYFQFKVERQRMLGRHKKQMALEGKVFASQERITDKEAFRLYLKIGAGFVDWMAGPKGGVVPVPRSLNFSNCSEEEFAEYRDSVSVFLRSEHALKYLYPALTPQMAEQCMESILEPFERNHDERPNPSRA